MTNPVEHRFKGAFLVGIAIVTGVSWFRDTAITYFPNTAEGDARFEYFQQYVSIESMDTILAPYTGDLGEVWLALFTFLYVDFLDTSVSVKRTCFHVLLYNINFPLPPLSL